MTIETLTDDERACLQFDGGTVGEKALRCIDQRDAEIARLKDESCGDPYECWKELRAEVARLKEALAAAEQETAYLKRQNKADHDALSALRRTAEKERDTANAAWEDAGREVARLTEAQRKDLEAVARQMERAEAAEQKLAALRAGYTRGSAESELAQLRAKLEAMMLLQRSTYLRAEAAEREIPRLCGECGYSHREYESHGRRRDVD